MIYRVRRGTAVIVLRRDTIVDSATKSFGKIPTFFPTVAVQALIQRRVVRLRALVLLPSRDLAIQVHAVFQRYARDTGLRVGLAIGQTNFLEEQLALVGGVALAGEQSKLMLLTDVLIHRMWMNTLLFS